MLTDRYLDGIPADSRASRGGSLSKNLLTDEALSHIRALNEIAAGRGQSLAAMALAWALRDDRVTTRSYRGCLEPAFVARAERRAACPSQ